MEISYFSLVLGLNELSLGWLITKIGAWATCKHGKRNDKSSLRVLLWECDLLLKRITEESLPKIMLTLPW